MSTDCLRDNKKCYASILGDCVGPISNEHYISDSVLKLFGNNLQIMGFPWQDKGCIAKVSKTSLVANILCTKHNSELSEIDALAGEFFKTIHTCFRGGTQGLDLPL